MGNEPICMWCHAGGLEQLESMDCQRERLLVHPSHRAQLESYCRETATMKWRFLGGIGLSILLGILGALLVTRSAGSSGAVIAGAAVALVGVTLLRYPFATPETVAWIGVRRSITVVRLAACVILALAIGVAAYGLSL